MMGPRIPVLCYHRVEEPPASDPGDENFVTPAQFAEHMSLLANLGFTGVTVRDIVRWQRGEGTLPSRPVAVTFDDAYESIVTHAMPVLATHRWPCTVYVVSNCVGRTNVWDPAAPRATLLDAPALRTLHTAGHEIGSHSRRHRRITTLTAAEATDELQGSRLELEALLGAPVVSFAFPYGTHDRTALDRVQAAGYLGACTLKRWGNGRGSNPLRMGRMGVGGQLPNWLLAAKLGKMLATPAFS
jgi:peptidoglycan/xylan/chitin deacetylase (PgdA/CDA1 family)